MPSPSSALATQRPDLAASFEAFDLEAEKAKYIAPRVAPVIEVAKPSGTFGKITLDQLLQNRDTRRAPGSGYSRGKFNFTSANYVCEEHGIEEVVDDNESKMYANYFDAETVSARRAFNAVLLNAERRWASAIFNATVWTGGSLFLDTAVTWATLATAAPLTDVETAVQAIFANSGLWADALIISRKTFRDLRNTTQIIDRVKYQGFMDVRAGNITVEALSQAFDLEVIVAGSSRNSATEGQTAVPAPVWSNGFAMVAKLCRTNDVKEPGLARTFHWNEDGSDIDGRFETYRDETVRGDVVRCRHQVDEIVMYKEAGFLLKID